MTVKFNFNSKDLGTLKAAARYMKLEWRTLAARPVVANHLLELVKELGLEAGCEESANPWRVILTTVTEILDEVEKQTGEPCPDNWEAEGVVIRKWVADNDAHFHSWHGESYRCMAETNEAIREAKRLGKVIVVMEYLS